MKSIKSTKINSHYKLHLILSNTNCSIGDIKCLNNIEIHALSHSQRNSSVDGSVIKCVEQSYYDQNRKECLKCSNKCPDNSRLEKKCNQTHDTQCVCNSGFFMAIDSGCKPCSQCEPGWGEFNNTF